MSKNLNRTVDILIELAPQLLQRKSPHNINTSGLETLGYSKLEISYALSLLLDKNPKIFKKKLRKNDETNFLRILQKEEKNLFTKEAFHDVMWLRTLGIIDEDELNDIIERASIYFFDKVTREDLRQMVAYILDQDDSIDLETGIRYHLRKNDQIH